jgi:basic membrane lipoprotein Med (substrate-binding protein (PBP1-ABC) superfamily)
VIVSVSAALSADDVRARADEFPQVYFIQLGGAPPGQGLPANLLWLGGPESRQDQAAFLAGMAAGFATQTQKIAVIGDPSTAEGRKYRNGFLHGVRYACPKCRVDFIDVLDVNDSAGLIQPVTVYVSSGFDVFFAAAGKAGNDALVAAAQKGAWVIGSGGDAYLGLFGNGSVAGADRVLTSVSVDPGEALRAALAAFHDEAPLYGVQPLSAANGAIVLAPIRNPAGLLSIPDQADIAAAFARLADGSLETGIDPATGEEK